MLDFDSFIPIVDGALLRSRLFYAYFLPICLLYVCDLKNLGDVVISPIKDCIIFRFRGQERSSSVA